MISLDGNWEAEKLDPSSLSQIVVQVHLIAYPNGENEGDEGAPPTNHWCIFLELQNQNSVRLDMMPGWGSDGRRGKIEVSTKPYRVTRNHIKLLTFGATMNVTAGKIINLILKRGRHEYHFTPEWEGCRHWNKIVLGDLEGSGFIQPGSAHQAQEAMSFYWIFPTGAEIRSMREGTFCRVYSSIGQ